MEDKELLFSTGRKHILDGGDNAFGCRSAAHAKRTRIQQWDLPAVAGQLRIRQNLVIRRSRDSDSRWLVLR